jgi:hypothetical protein
MWVMGRVFRASNNGINEFLSFIMRQKFHLKLWREEKKLQKLMKERENKNGVR